MACRTPAFKSILLALAVGLGALVAPAPTHARDAEPVVCADLGDGLIAAAFARLSTLYRQALPGPSGVHHRERAISRLIHRWIDMDRFAALAMGTAWALGDASAQGRWADVLAGVLERRYLDRLGDPKRAGLVVGSGVPIAGCLEIQIPAVLNMGSTRSDLSFTLVPHDGETRWRASNIFVDGVDLAVTWARRFEGSAAQGGLVQVEADMARLKARYPRRSKPASGR